MCNLQYQHFPNFCICLPVTNSQSICPTCREMIYTPILSHPAWLMIGVVEYDNHDPVTPNWDWIHQLARKDCLHNFWQVYRHTCEPFQFRWCCVSCQTSFVMQQKENLLEEEWNFNYLR